MQSLRHGFAKRTTKISQFLTLWFKCRTAYLTISNALQWRLQYRRVIQQAGDVAGISRVR